MVEKTIEELEKDLNELREDTLLKFKSIAVQQDQQDRIIGEIIRRLIEVEAWVRMDKNVKN